MNDLKLLAFSNIIIMQFRLDVNVEAIGTKEEYKYLGVQQVHKIDQQVMRKQTILKVSWLVTK